MFYRYFGAVLWVTLVGCAPPMVGTWESETLSQGNEKLSFCEYLALAIETSTSAEGEMEMDIEKDGTTSGDGFCDIELNSNDELYEIHAELAFEGTFEDEGSGIGVLDLTMQATAFEINGQPSDETSPPESLGSMDCAVEGDEMLCQQLDADWLFHRRE